MLTWYKNRKKEQYEAQLRKMIQFNKERIELYNNNTFEEVKEVFRKTNESSMCMGYSTKTLDEIAKKYKVNKILINESIEKEKETLKAYDDVVARHKLKEKEDEEKYKIELYKKAILELKKENKI